MDEQDLSHDRFESWEHQQVGGWRAVVGEALRRFSLLDWCEVPSRSRFAQNVYSRVPTYGSASCYENSAQIWK